MARILLIDDDESIIALYKGPLTSAGHEVLSAPDGMTGLDTLYNYTIDMVIIDANMPYMSGFTLLDNLQKSPRFKSLVKVMFTSRSDKADIQLAIKRGVTNYIIKPIKPPEFVEKVQALVPKLPQSSSSEVRLGEDEQISASVISMKSRVMTISEIGMTVASDVHFSEGLKFDLKSKFFEIWGKDSCEMKVEACQKFNDNYFTLYLSFTKTTTEQIEKLKKWIIENRGALVGKKAS